MRMNHYILVGRRLLSEEIYGQILVTVAGFVSPTSIVRRLFVISLSDQRGTDLKRVHYRLLNASLGAASEADRLVRLALNCGCLARERPRGVFRYGHKLA